MATSICEKKTDFPTLVEIKSKLPSDCFRSELSTSMYYVLRSAILVSTLFIITYILVSPSSSFFLESNSIKV